eukprot:6833678-Prymnesium_polylepis.1
MHGSGRAWAPTNAGARVLEQGTPLTRAQGGEEFRHFAFAGTYPLVDERDTSKIIGGRGGRVCVLRADGTRHADGAR